MSTSCVRTGLSLAVLISLAACGGGSGSTGSPDDTDLTSLSLGASNYQAVGQATVASGLFLGSTGSLAGGNRGGPLMLRQAQSADRAQPAVVVGPVELACNQGGSVAVSFNDANNSGDMDVGESLFVEAKACKEDGATTQGRIDLAMQSLTGVYGSGSFSATLGMKLTAFGISQGTNAIQGDGDLGLKLSRTPAGVGEMSLTLPRVTLTGRLAGQAIAYGLADLQLTVRDEVVNGTARSTLTYSGTLTNNADGKQVRVSTPQALVIVGEDAYPSAGQLLVRGRASSSVRITPVNAVQVRIELDADGDGSYEANTLKNWAELL